MIYLATILVVLLATSTGRAIIADMRDVHGHRIMRQAAAKIEAGVARCRR